MLSKTIRAFLATFILMVFTSVGVHNANAQLTRFQSNSLYPVEMTAGVGGGLNTNMANGTFNPSGSGAIPYTIGDYNEPEFHAMVEIPISDNFMLVPRVTYNDFSNVLDSRNDATVPSSQTSAYKYRLVGGELLGKLRVYDGLHVMAGGNVSGAVERTADFGVAKTYASTTPTTSLPKTLVSAEGGLGYDIPVSATNRVWITPEVMAAVPLQNMANQDQSGIGSLHSVTISSRISMKFGLGSR